MGGIAGIGQSNQFANTGTPSQGATGGAGMYGGMGVRPLVKDVRSMLLDAAEEVAIVFAEKSDRKLEEREVKASGRHGMTSEEIDVFLDESHDEKDREELASIVAQLLAGKQPPKQLLEQHYSKDATQQYVTLQYALRKGRSEGTDPEILERIEDAIAELALDQGKDILAGLNTIKAASGHVGHDRKEIEAFHDCYREIVREEQTLWNALKALLERVGAGEGRIFEDELAAMIKAVGHDLSAQRPSTDPPLLQKLLSDIYHLEVMKTVLEKCKALVVRLDLAAPTAA